MKETTKDCDWVALEKETKNILLVFNGKKQVLRLILRLVAKLWDDFDIIKPFLRIRSNQIIKTEENLNDMRSRSR